MEDSEEYMKQKSTDVKKSVKKIKKQPTEKTIAVAVQENDSSYAEAKQAVDELVIKDGDIWSCRTCGKTEKTNCQMRKHAEIHIEGLSFPCSFCDKIFLSRVALCNVIINSHNIKIEPFYNCFFVQCRSRNARNYHKHMSHKQLQQVIMDQQVIYSK